MATRKEKEQKKQLLEKYYNEFISLYDTVSDFIKIEGMVFYSRLIEKHYSQVQYKKMIRTIEWIQQIKEPDRIYIIRYLHFANHSILVLDVKFNDTIECTYTYNVKTSKMEIDNSQK